MRRFEALTGAFALAQQLPLDKRDDSNSEAAVGKDLNSEASARQEVLILAAMKLQPALMAVAERGQRASQKKQERGDHSWTR